MLTTQKHLGYLLLLLPPSCSRLTPHECIVHPQRFLPHILVHLAICWSCHSLLWQCQIHRIRRHSFCRFGYNSPRPLPPPRCSRRLPRNVSGLHGYWYWYLGHMRPARHHGLRHPPRNSCRRCALGYVWIHWFCNWSNNCRFSVDQHLT